MPKKHGHKTTWTQLKHLIKKTKKLVKAQQKPKTPKFIFLAVLSLLMCQNAVMHSKSYWAYVPKPSLIHPVGWMDPDYVKVLTNNTKLLKGFQNYEKRINSSAYLNFEGRTNSLPIYIALKGSPPYGCLPINYQTFLTDAPDLTVKGKKKKKNDKRLMWELQISTLGYLNYNVTFKKAPFMPLPLCAEKFRDKDQF